MTPGSYFLCFLASVYIGQKGGALALLEMSLLPLFQTVLKVDSQLYQGLRLIIMSPFSLKGGMALLSDSRPLFGYPKRYYIVAATFMGTLSAAVLAARLAELNTACVTLLSFLTVAAVACTDILTEGKTSEIIRKDKTNTANKLVSFVWVCIFLSRLAASLLAGVLADHGAVPATLGVCAALLFQTTIPTLLGWLPEDRAEPAAASLSRLHYVVAANCLSAVITIAAAAGGVLWVQLLVAAVCVAALWVSSAQLLEPVVHRCNLYLFFSAILYADVSPLEYYYVSTSCADGPQFSYSWYITVCGVTSSISSAVAAYGVQRFLRNWSFKRIFVLGTVARCAGGLVDVAIVKQWTSHSRLLFVMGDCTMRSLVGMIDTIPSTVLVSKLSDKNAESTMYSILAGYQNIGSLISIVLGAALASRFEVAIDAERCNADHLPALLVIAQMLLPLLSLMFIVQLPNGSMQSSAEHLRGA